MGSSLGRAWVAALLCLAFAGASFAAAADGQVTFGTQFQERAFEVHDGVFLTAELRDKLHASTPPPGVARNTWSAPPCGLLSNRSKRSVPQSGTTRRLCVNVNPGASWAA